MFRQIVKAKTGYSFDPEYKFCQDRKWRFDFANFDLKVAVEVEGGAFTNGRHTRGKGFINDMEKYNKSAELGWVVLRYTPTQLNELSTYLQIKRVCDNRVSNSV